MVTQMLGKYSVHETLSKGSFSRVRYCIDTSTNIPHALRIIDRQKIEEVGLLENLRNEITIMKMFEHRSVVSVINMMASTNRVFLVLDVMLAGNMKIKLLKEQFLDEKDAIFYFLQLFSGVEYLHSMGVTHGNLRLENLLLHTNGNLKITDFRYRNHIAFARFLHRYLTRRQNTFEHQHCNLRSFGYSRYLRVVLNIITDIIFTMISFIMHHIMAGIPLANDIDINVINHNEDISTRIHIMSIIDTFVYLLPICFHIPIKKTDTDPTIFCYILSL